MLISLRSYHHVWPHISDYIRSNVWVYVWNLLLAMKSLRWSLNKRWQDPSATYIATSSGDVHLFGEFLYYTIEPKGPPRCKIIPDARTIPELKCWVIKFENSDSSHRSVYHYCMLTLYHMITILVCSVFSRLFWTALWIAKALVVKTIPIKLNLLNHGACTSSLSEKQLEESESSPVWNIWWTISTWIPCCRYGKFLIYIYIHTY